MLLAEVDEILDALTAAGVRHSASGGWAVDVLVGRQTREHRDLDLAVDADHVDTCLSTLTDLRLRAGDRLAADAGRGTPW